MFILEDGKDFSYLKLRKVCEDDFSMIQVMLCHHFAAHEINKVQNHVLN